MPLHRKNEVKFYLWRQNSGDDVKRRKGLLIIVTGQLCWVPGVSGPLVCVSETRTQLWSRVNWVWGISDVRCTPIVRDVENCEPESLIRISEKDSFKPYTRIHWLRNESGKFVFSLDRPLDRPSQWYCKWRLERRKTSSGHHLTSGILNITQNPV